ncbi:MAG: ECF-type sigma factor [Vicinamibacterales bacterium]
MSRIGQLTTLLQRAGEGDSEAADAVFTASYPVLRQLAHARLRGHVRSPTIDTALVVHEAYLRFVQAGDLKLEDELHFRRWASKVMRSVIVDLVRRRQATRRGGDLEAVSISTDLPMPGGDRGQHLVLRVHDALTAFAEVDARAAQVVEMRFFAGMTEPEVAAALGVNERTVRRDWERARLMLGDMLR